MENIFKQLEKIPDLLVEKIKKEWSFKLKDLKAMIPEEKFKECSENAYRVWLSEADGSRDMYNKYENWYNNYKKSDYIYDEQSNTLYCSYFVLNIGRGGYNNQTLSYNVLRKECKLCKDNKIELIFDYRGPSYDWEKDGFTIRKKIFLIETDDNMDKLLSFKRIE